MRDWSEKKILVAEDEDMNYLLIYESLKRTNVQLTRAFTGQDVIDIFKNDSEFDLVLMDIKMPLVNGYEATKIIKAIRNVPVIAQTAYAMVGEQKESEQAGCDAYITKPIKISLLFELIEQFFAKS